MMKGVRGVMEKQDLIVPCSLGCTIYGIWVSFCEIFGCQVNYGSFLVPAFVIAGAVTLLLMPWRWKASLGILAAGTLLLAWYGSRHLERLLAEGEGMLYYVNQRYYEYYDTYLLENCREYGMEHTLLWILLGIAFCVFTLIFAFRLRNLQYGFLPSYLVVGAGLVVGKTPGIRGVIFLLLGFVLAMFWINGQEWGGRSRFYIMKVGRQGAGWHRYPLFLLLLAAVLLLAGRFAGRTEGKILSHGKKVQDVQRNLEERVTQMATDISRFVQGNYSVDSNGKLNNSEPKYAERPVMEITMPEKPSANVYLKGFVGSHYRNGEWKREDVETFEELFPTDESKYAVNGIWYEKLSRWMDWRYDDYMMHSVTDAIDAGDDNVNHPVVNKGQVPRSQHMQIEFVGGGKWSGYTYLPYFASLEEVYDAEEGKGLAELDSDFLKGDSSRSKVSSPYYFNYVGMAEHDLLNYYTSCKTLDYNEEPDILCPIDFSEIEGSPMKKNERKLQDLLDVFSRVHGSTVGNYLAYAMNEYGYQGESKFFKRKDFQKKLKNFNVEYRNKNKLRKMSSMDRMQLVQQILKEEAEYSKILEKVPEGADYAEYFLLTQKKGFCEHFATAGTLLMRELGIPSRYVGGYKVPLDRFKEDEDGNYTAEVLDSDAHAWTEILAGSLGWLPADMTPSSDSGRRKKKVVAKRAATSTPKPQKTKKPKVTPAAKPTATVKATPTADAGKKKEQKKKVALPRELVLLGKVAAGIGGILLLACLGILGCRAYYGGRKRRLLHARGRSRNLYVRMRLHDLLSLLRGCGVSVSGKMPEGQWLPAIKRLCRDSASGTAFDDREQEEFLRIVQKAAFSKEEVTQEEYDAFRRQCGKLDGMAWERAGKMRRLCLKLMGKYGNI